MGYPPLQVQRGLPTPGSGPFGALTDKASGQHILIPQGCPDGFIKSSGPTGVLLAHDRKAFKSTMALKGQHLPGRHLWSVLASFICLLGRGAWLASCLCLGLVLEGQTFIVGKCKSCSIWIIHPQKEPPVLLPVPSRPWWTVATVVKITWDDVGSTMQDPKHKREIVLLLRCQLKDDKTKD